MSFLFSVNQFCLYITCDMIYVIHGNKITFIVIVIVIVIVIDSIRGQAIAWANDCLIYC